MGSTAGSRNMNISEFLNMGGYAFYVWTSYAVVLIVLIANVLYPLRRKRRIIRDLERKFAGTKY